MKQTYITPSRKKDWLQAAILVILLLLVNIAHAQEGSQGNTTVFAGSQMTMFGNHDFATGGGGVQAGIVNTERTTSTVGTGYGVLNYASAALTANNADPNNHVDGYVRNLGAGKFVYPVGDNFVYRPFAATAANTVGAYFNADPNVAITSKVGGGSYPVLPATGPFPTTSKAMTVGKISNIEYWDIDGASPTQITLSWDVASGIAALTGSSLSKLIIVGWDPALSQWVKIPSAWEAPSSIWNSASTLTRGSIVTNAAIVPNNYTVYTLAAAVPDLTPTIDIDELNFSVGDSRDFVVNIYEINDVDATGAITFRIPRLSGFDITYSLASGISDVFGGTSNFNSDWTFTPNTSFITVSMNNPPGLIPRNGQSTIGFTITRKPGVASGTTQNITATVIGTSGGEINSTNNAVVTSVSTN